MHTTGRRYNTPEKRWAGIGPYYAMFPVNFADDVIQKYTNPNDGVLDPFAGRGTAVYSAAIQDRIGIGIEINPVGWVYGKAKIFPAEEAEVKKRLEELARESSQYLSEAEELPTFFHYCFSLEVRTFLLAVRNNLNWRKRKVDWTVAALLLIYLHGKRDQSFSNQMRQTKSMSAQYAVNWWKNKNLVPPLINPIEFMEKRINWRYAKGHPNVSKSRIYLGDCTKVLSRLLQLESKRQSCPIRLLFTSPPYCGVTNYHYDQWLRLWLLGFSGMTSSQDGKHKGRFWNRKEYSALLYNAFKKSSQILSRDAVIYVRTDNRSFTYKTTVNTLKEIFPKKKMTEILQPFSRPTQTHLFGDQSKKAGEVDIVMHPK